MVLDRIVDLPRLGLMRWKPNVITLADRARDAGQWERAAQLYRKALDRNPRNPPIWVQYGHALKLQGKTEEAQAAYLRAFALDPLLPHPLRELSGLGWSERQTSELRGLGGSNLTPPTAATPKAAPDENEHPGQNGSRGGSNPPRRGLIRRRPGAIALADRARNAGEWGRAEQLYRKALNGNPREPAIWVQYAHALKESGELSDPEKLAQAEMAYRRAVSLDPSVADTYLQLGHVLKLQGKTEEAEAAYLHACALDPSVSYPSLELQGLGWSEARLAELQELLAEGSSPVIAPRAARNGQSHPSHATAVGSGVRSPKPRSAVSRYPSSAMRWRAVRHPFPDERLKSYVTRYLDSLKRQGIAIVLIVNADGPFSDIEIDVDGLFVRRNEGYDFAGWAHILRLHPELFDATILYLLNDSVIGPTNDASFGEMLTRLRDSPAGFIGLTENFQRRWHIQSYFLALKRPALSSVSLRKLISDILSYKDLEEMVNQFRDPARTDPGRPWRNLGGDVSNDGVSRRSHCLSLEMSAAVRLSIRKGQNNLRRLPRCRCERLEFKVTQFFWRAMPGGPKCSLPSPACSRGIPATNIGVCKPIQSPLASPQGKP